MTSVCLSQTHICSLSATALLLGNAAGPLGDPCPWPRAGGGGLDNERSGGLDPCGLGLL